MTDTNLDTLFNQRDALIAQLHSLLEGSEEYKAVELKLIELEDEIVSNYM